MANNFSIELTGRLNQKDTIKNINSSLSEIAKDPKLNSLNLTIKEVKLSKEALSKLNNLKITPTIAGFNIDAQAVQANINKIGQSVGKNLSSAIVGSTSSKELKDKLKAELESIAREMRSNKLAGISKQFNINEKDTGDIAVQLKKLVKIYNDSISEMSKTITPMNMFDKSSQEFQDASNRFEQAFSTMSRAGGQIDRIVQEYGKLKNYFGTNSFFANFIDEYKGRTFYIPNAEDLSPEFGGLKGLNQAFIGHDIHFTKNETKGSYDFNELADELTRIAGIDTSSITNDMDLLNKLIEHLMVSSEKIKELTPISDIYGGDISAFSATSSNFSEIIDLIDKAGLVSKNFATQIQEVTQTEIQGTATFVLEENKKQEAIEQTNQAIQANENVGTHLFDSFSGFIGTLDQADRRLRMLADTQKEVVTISKSLDEQGNLTGFTASVKKATGEVEKLRFGLDETGEQFQFLGGTSNDSVAQNIKHYQTELDKLQKKYAQTDFDFAPLEKAIEQYRQTGTELNKLQAVYDETARSVNEYYTALKSKDVSLDPIQQALNEMRTMDTVLNSLQDKISGLKDNTGLLTQLNTLRQEHERLNKVIQANNGKIPFNKEWTKSYAQLSAQVKDLEKNVKSSNKKIDEFANARLSNRIDDWLRKNTKAAKDYGAQLEQIKKQTEGADAITLKRLRAEFDAVKKAAADAGKLGKNFFETLKEGATKFTEWVMASGMIMQTVYAFKQMLVEVKNIDTAMTNLYKVTDETEGKYNEFLKISYTNAQRLGRSVTDLVEMTANWAKLGYGIDEATKLAEASTIYANVGEVDAETSVSDLVTAMKAFNIAAEDSITIVDKLNRLGNEFAVSSKDLGDGLQNSASMLAMGGNTIEETLALITGGAEITQSTEEVSTALRIGQMRVQGMKGALEELGETVDDDVESISKMQTHILNLTKGKVNIFDANNQFRSYYDILQDISTVIDSLSSTERADLIETLFGKNRANQGAAVIQAFQSGQVQKALEAATNAEGSALAEQQKWLESTEAKLQQFSAAWQAFSNTIINSDVVKFFIDSSTGVLSTLTKIVDAIGDIPTAMAVAMSAVAIKSGGIIQNLNGELGVFGKTLSSIKKDFGTGQGLLYSIFGTGLNGSDKEILHSIAIGFQDASVSAEQLNEQAKGLSVAGRQIYKDFVTGKISLEEFAAAEKTATLSSKALTVALNVGIIAAITAVASVISYVIRKQEEATQAAIQAGQAAKTESENLIDLRNAYLEAQNSLDDSEQSKQKLETATDNLAKALGIERDTVQGLAGDYEKLNNAINANTLSELRKNAPALWGASREQDKALLKAAKKNQIAFEKSGLTGILLGENYEADEIITRLIKESGIGNTEYKTDGDVSELFLSFGDVKTAEDAVKAYEQLGQVIEYIDSSRAEDVTAAKEQSDTYNRLVTIYNNLAEQVQETTDAKTAYYNNEKQIWAITNADTLALAKNADEYNTLKETIISAAVTTKKFAGSEEEVRQSLEDVLKLQPELRKFYEEDLTPKVDPKKTKTDLEKELKELQKSGSVNLEVRPVINAKDLKDAGWQEAGEGIATVFTSTFTNAVGDIAMNFTPIIADPKTGEYKGVLTPEELEKYALGVINGVRDDDLNLKIGADFVGDDAISKAEQAAERIHQIHEDLYGDSGIISQSFGSKYGITNAFGGWIDNANEYVSALEAVQSESSLAASALDEYNKNGVLSATTAKQLINSNVGYSKALKNTKNGIVLVENELKKELIAYIEDLKTQYEVQKSTLGVAKAKAEAADKIAQLNKQVVIANGAQDTEEGKKAIAEADKTSEVLKQATKNYDDAVNKTKEYQEQIDLLSKEQAKVGTLGTGSTGSKNTKPFTKNENTYNWESAWLKDQQAKIDKLKYDYNKIDQQLKKAIEAGDEEQIKLLTDLALKKSKELRDSYASIASEGRTRYDNIMSRIYALAPELAGKDIDNITEAEIMAATKRLDDKITAEENKAIAMYNADNKVKDPNKAGIEAAKNAKTYFSAYVSEAQEYLKAFKSGEGTFSEGWAEQIEKDSDTIKSEFEALNNIFDKEIENTKRKAESLDLQIDLLDEDDYINKIDLIGKKSVENANTQARLAAEIEKVTREFGNGEVPAEDYQARIDELTDSYNECVKSAQSFKNELKDIAEQEISDITSIESDVKGYLEDYISLVEDNAQKEIDAAEKTADAKKKAIEKQKDALQDYQDQLEKQWDAEDERDARREKLDERNKLATDRAKTLTAAASGDLEALNRIQDLDSEIAKLDKELQEELDKQWREDIKDYIGEQVEALDKQADKLDEQLDVMKKQLEAAQQTNEELLKGESGYAMVHALMAGNTVKIGNNEVDLNTMIQKLADESGDSSRYGYAYESANWQKDLGLALASVANLDALNSLATGNFSLQNGVIVLGDGSTLDLNNLSGRQPLSALNQPLSPDGNFVSATGLLGAVTGMQNGIASNPEIYENLMKQQTELNNNINRLLEKSTDVVIDNLLNIEGDVTEDVIPKIRQAIDKYAPAAVQELFNRSVSTGFSRNGVTGKSKWIK